MESGRLFSEKLPSATVAPVQPPIKLLGLGFRDENNESRNQKAEGDSCQWTSFIRQVERFAVNILLHSVQVTILHNDLFWVRVSPRLMDFNYWDQMSVRISTRITLKDQKG